MGNLFLLHGRQTHLRCAATSHFPVEAVTSLKRPMLLKRFLLYIYFPNCTNRGRLPQSWLDTTPYRDGVQGQHVRSRGGQEHPGRCCAAPGVGYALRPLLHSAWFAVRVQRGQQRLASTLCHAFLVQPDARPRMRRGPGATGPSYPTPARAGLPAPVAPSSHPCTHHTQTTIGLTSRLLLHTASSPPCAGSCRKCLAPWCV